MILQTLERPNSTTVETAIEAGALVTSIDDKCSFTKMRIEFFLSLDVLNLRSIKVFSIQIDIKS